MCGICGVIDYNENKKVDEGLVRKMCAQMRHRGPDDEGVYINTKTTGIGLGHRRLSIIDLSPAAHQPFSNEDKSIHMVINGEIYNYKLLREELKQKGHKFKSKSDAEVVVHLYEEYGQELVRYLRGPFALAIWDERQNKLLLARDRLGQKPLIYSNIAGRFCFASEFTSLLASDLIKKDINYEAMHYYLSFGYVPAPLTIYKNVFKLLPAHILILKDTKIEQYCYWQLDYTKKRNISLPEAGEELLKILEEAVGIRLYSDVPYGAFLSGGIDSSTVISLMTKILGGRVKTFSIGFSEKDYDELAHARRIAKLFNTEHREFIVKPNVLEVMPILVEHYGEPYADSSALPTYYLARETKKYVTVALNGDGGDESFAGYERYQAVYLAQIYNRIPSVLRNALTDFMLKILPDSINTRNKFRRARRFLEDVSMPFYSRYLHWVRALGEEEKKKIYTEGFYAQLQTYDSVRWLRDFPNLPGGMELLERLLLTDIKTNLANDLLVKMDIASSANSLEGRSPFLDHRVMEFAASLPVNFKMRHFIKKYLLKKTVSKFLPHANIYRKKMGFGVPIEHWMRNELRDYVKRTLLSKRALDRGYFNSDTIKTYINEHIHRLKDHTFGLWTLLNLELWHLRFIDNEKL